MVFTNEDRARGGRKGGITSAARLTPAERVARAEKAQRASAAARRRQRDGLDLLIEDLTAQGWTLKQIEERYGVKPRVNGSAQYRQPVPSAAALEPYLIEVDRDYPNGELTWHERQKEATVRLRKDRARAIAEGLGK